MAGNELAKRVETALGADVVVNAQRAVSALDNFNPNTMTADDLGTLADYGTVLSAAVKKLEDEQRDILAPFKEGIAKIQARFSPILGPLKVALVTARTLHSTARNSINRRAAEEAARAQAELDAAAAAAAEIDPLDDEPAPPPAVAAVDAPANKQVGAVGTATGRKVLRVRLVDAAALATVAPHLLKLDETAARTYIRAEMDRQGALVVLPGLEYSWDETTSFGARR